MRDDIFIIWGNGVNHLEEILNMIREEYPIFFIQKHEIEEMESFIKKVYACDTVPWKHLITKSQYLLKAPAYCYTVYVENPNPQECYYGKGEFRHIQCAKIKATKERIRNRFNPRRPNGKRTEEHVIHGTDYMEQVEYLAKYFKIPKKETRKTKPPKARPFKIGLLNLYCNILGSGFVPIKQTPHFKYLNGDSASYRNYILKYIGRQLIHDHLPGAYDFLIENFDEKKADGILVRKKKEHLVTIDGVHRACIFLHQGVEEVEGYLC